MFPELTTSPLFGGIPEGEIDALLQCLGAVERRYAKGEVIFPEGEPIECLGVVLSGRVLIQYCDVFGTASILGSAGVGDTFGEAYACCPGAALEIEAVAAEDTAILLLNVQRILTTCPNSCAFHAGLIRNLLTVCAQKNLSFSRRMLHTTPKTIRGRLLSYFSERVKVTRSRRFALPFNRQQLADYLGVDRSALSAELSKMQKDGLIRYDRKTVEICQTEHLPL